MPTPLTSAPSIHWPFDNSYTTLPGRFFSRQQPTPVANPSLVVLNTPLAEALNLELEATARADLAQIFAGNLLPTGSDPLAMAYAGHQFGHFVPQLGDGRALLLGEVIDRNGKRQDLHFKGSGPTPFSRRGDGRAALGPMLREYLISEAMHALGIPTTRSLAVVLTGETVRRQALLPGAILTRVAASHVRVGTFQYFACRQDKEALQTLTTYTLQRHFPELTGVENPALALLQGVIAKQAELISQWLMVGFIHGVMNTDNMALSGETIDYGPCAFMDIYDPATVFSSIDESGRYAYANQPSIAQWNLARLADCLLSLLDPDIDAAQKLAEAELDRFSALFSTRWQTGMGRKLGLGAPQADDQDLCESLLELMQRFHADFTNTFRALYHHAANPEVGEHWFAIAPDTQAWLQRWRSRFDADPAPLPTRLEMMRQANPAFIPRNHRVEQALKAAEMGDLAPFKKLLQVLAQPYDDQPEHQDYTSLPQPEERVYQTFCGT
jgi:serine/tyrosine/threonine adenylyltransferase